MRVQQQASKQLRRACSGPQSNRGPEIEKKMLPRYPGWFSPIFSATAFFLFGPPRCSETVIYWGFGPFLAASTQRSSGPGPKTEKHNFPVLGVPKRKKIITTLSRMVVCNFLTFYVLTDRTPTGGKTQNTRIWGHFGLGRPLALEQFLGPGRQQKIAIFWC